jgi:competence protein ComEC
VLLWVPWLGLAWTVAVVHFAAGLPLAAVQIGEFGMVQVATAYAVIGLAKWHGELWTLLPQHPGSAAGHKAAGAAAAPTKRNLLSLLVAPATAAAVAAVAALLWAAALAQPDGRLHVWFLDVGQGDAIFIQTPSGRQVLIDGGASAQALLGQMGAVMPFWDRSLDLVVLTHPDADHMDAQVAALGRYRATAAWMTAAGAASTASAAWQAAATAAGAQVQIQAAGGWAEFGDGVAIWVLSPDAPGFAGEDTDNENSLVAKLVYGEFSALLTGDAGAQAEAQLAARRAPLGSTVLKVAHHGSKFSTSEEFVRSVDPLLAVIQVGAGNDYGHPSPETLARLAEQTILRTDENGAIEVTSDGRQMWVETEQGRN